MNSSSHWLLADNTKSSKLRRAWVEQAWIRNSIFAVIYTVAVLMSFSVVYSGTLVAVFWPPIGIAVWWAVSSQTWRMYFAICAYVFILPSLYIGINGSSSLAATILFGFSNVIAGPAVAILLLMAERLLPTDTSEEDKKLFAPFARIRFSRHVYRLLGYGLVTVVLAKLLVVMGFIIDGTAVSSTLYLSLILRDLAGLLLIAGPGIAVTSSIVATISRRAWREFYVVVVVTAALLVFIFGFVQDIPIIYLAMLPLYWSATRLPVPLASIHAGLTAAGTILFAHFKDAEPFIGEADSPLAQAASFQIFTIMCILLSLVVSTTVQHHSALAEELNVLTRTIPEALIIKSKSGKVFPVNKIAEEHLAPENGETTSQTELRDIHGNPLTEEHRPSTRALNGEIVSGVQIEVLPGPEDPQTGEKRFFSMSAAPIYLEGETEPGHALLVFHDSTHEYRMMRQMRMAFEEAYLLFEHAPQGIAILDDSGQITQANQAFSELVGVPQAGLVDRKLDDFTVEQDVVAEVVPALNSPGDLVHMDCGFKTAHDETKNVVLSFRAMSSENDASARLLLNVVDVTEREKLHELVAHVADHDSLTGLINRRRFEFDFGKILLESERDGTDGALMMLDIDHFKPVNDTLGHVVGDEVLIEFSQVLTEAVRSDDIVGRLGGDEFVIILPNTSREAANSVGKRIVRAVRDRFQNRPDEIAHITTSIGFTMFSEAREQDLDPFLYVDRLLYEAKRNGRNRVASAHPMGDTTDLAKPFLTREYLEDVLESDALRIEFQPIVVASTGQIAGAESLLRVDSDVAQASTPEFVTAVERAGLAPKLDVQVLRMGMKALKQFRSIDPDFRLSVNISAQSMCSEDVRRAFIEELEANPLEPGTFNLEITETAPLSDLKAAQRFQQDMIGHGLDFALDDFGVGNEPFLYLKNLEFTKLKIAGEFIEGMVKNELDNSIVDSIAQLARKQGLVTVAEFVSSEEILDAVRAKGITYAQGFLIGKSMPIEDFIHTHLEPNLND